MLRPATPLTVLLFVAFALLLISVLSTPIIEAIPLGSFQGANFGVFGYCNSAGCSKIEIGYDTSDVLQKADASDFDLPNSTRTTLSAILVVHPVAALFTLIMLILAFVAHFHAPSHSSRYLLILFIVGILNFLLCLLAFLIDVLLFVPHLAWGSYLVLAATILVALGGLVSCAMRRTLVNRKARKKRIAENAEMSGENFYNRQATEVVAPTPMQPTMPVVSGANGGTDKLPTFASYEKKDDRSSDERIPLTARSPSDRSPNNMPTDMSTAETAYNLSNGPRRSPSAQRQQLDQYGNPINAPQDAYGMGMRRPPSLERPPSASSRGSRGGGGYRGRGGYPGRGGYGPYGGPPPGRGGYGPPGRGGYGPPPGGRGGYGPPPRGYGGPMMRGGRPPPPGYNGGPYDRRGSPAEAYGAYGGRGPSPAAPAYNMNPSMPSVSTGSYDAYNPDRDSELPRAESPPPLPGAPDLRPGQAVEMDATTGSPQHPPQGFGQFRESDADIAGMVGLQQGRSTPNRHDTYMSETSKYSTDEQQYVPPRQQWNQGQGRNSPSVPSPLNVNRSAEGSRSPPPAPKPTAGDNYYEDIDPRFEAPSRPTPPPGPPAIPASNSYESIPDGARSPAESERSNFTSISQRGVNPRWNPPPPPAPYQQLPPRRPINRNDMLLNNNPDFQLPGARAAPSPPRNSPGMVPGSAYPGGL